MPLKIASSLPVPTEAVINERTKQALGIEQKFSLLKTQTSHRDQGLYQTQFSSLQRQAQNLQRLADLDFQALSNKGIKVTKQITAAQQALAKQQSILNRISAIAPLKHIISPTSIPPTSTSRAPVSGTPVPWEGQLHPGQSPLDWAVCNHRHELAVWLLLNRFPGTTGEQPLRTALYEAVLQQDSFMVECLYFPKEHSNAAEQAKFSAQIQAMRKQSEDLQKINPDFLSPTCRAALEGNIDALSTATDVNVQDVSGRTPLHYAILARQYDTVRYLLRVSNPYTLTAQNLSYLDVAVLSGDLQTYLLCKSFNIPLKGITQEQLPKYLFATGIYERWLKAQADAQDPLAIPETEISMGATRAAWLLSSLISYLVPVQDTSGWIPWLIGSGATNVKAFSGQLNDILHTPQTFGLLPSKVSQMIGIYQLSQLAYWIVSASVNKLTGYELPVLPAATSFLDSKLPGTSKWLSIGYTALSVWGAAKPIFDHLKLETYEKLYPSRSAHVWSNLGLRVWNVISQSIIGFNNMPSATG